MLFTSYEFLAFLALVLLIYFIAPKRMQWIVLLVASYLYYFLAGAEYLIFILVTTISSWGIARIMDGVSRRAAEYIDAHREEMDKEERRAYKAAQKKKNLRILCVGLALNFGILAVLKYAGFAVSNLNSLLHLFGSQNSITVPSLILPLGISFYTFQTMGYLIDVYRGKTEADKNPARLALFVSFFPQLVQGPISRHSDLAHQLYEPHRFNGAAFFSGMQRILWGYFKKLVIADRILVVMKELLSNTAEYDGAYVLLLILIYSVEIYADFTGGIDITIGIAEAMGITLKENFRHPFTSRSTKEYWNRWHITMGSWFTDYIFNPLSVAKPMQSLSKKVRRTFGDGVGKRFPVYVATIVTWFLTGLWHGASWNFIVWGLLNGLVILVSRELEPLYKKFRTKFPRLTASKPYGAFMIARTFLLMGVIRSLDCYRNVPITFYKWSTMFTTFNYGSLFADGLDKIGFTAENLIIVVIGTAIVCAVNMITLKCGDGVRQSVNKRPFLSYSLFALVLVSILLFGAYGIGYDASQFIYNQF